MIPIRPELTPSLRAYGARVEAVLARTLPREDAPPEILHRAMRYAVLGGGKRIRPMLAYATCAAFGRDAGAADGAAAAVEIIHGYSLAHDDLPAMDNDTLRRGRPTVWRQFDEWTAILAGDGLLTQRMLADDGRAERRTGIDRHDFVGSQSPIVQPGFVNQPDKRLTASTGRSDEQGRGV